MFPDNPYHPRGLAQFCVLVAEALNPLNPLATTPPAPVGGPTVRAGALERLDRWFWQHRLAEREEYVAGAVDVADVERRLRDIERDPRYY